MSRLRASDFVLVDRLFQTSPGYVLDFSNRSFAAFFGELGVDIDAPIYAEKGTSKMSRLRCFLRKADDITASSVLQELWAYRCARLGGGRTDPDQDAAACFADLSGRLQGQPVAERRAPPPTQTVVDFASLVAGFQQLMALEARPWGFAFETFLSDLFAAFGLAPRRSFRNLGEQIDGSFECANQTYLLEAKWQNMATGASDLHAFHGKVEGKSAWARGLFVSYTGFSADGLAAFGRGRKVICMDGLDLHELLARRLPLDAVLVKKERRAAETGLPFVPVRDLGL